MAIPGYKLAWYRNPAFSALLADVAIAIGALFSAATGFLARGPLYGSELAAPSVVFIAAIGKGVLTWRDKAKTHQHHGLVGCLHTLDSVLRASSEQEMDHGLRLTIHTPVDGPHGKQLEQVVDYVSTDGKLRKGAGRRFMQQCGILGKAYRTAEPFIAVREQEDYEKYLKELMEKWNYSEEQAKALRIDGKSFMAAPLIGDGNTVEAVLYLDSSRANYFTPNRVKLVENACSGIALFIGREYNRTQQ